MDGHGYDVGLDGHNKDIIVVGFNFLVLCRASLPNLDGDYGWPWILCGIGWFTKISLPN